MVGDPWEGFHGPNLGYVLEQYDLYLEDPDLVDAELRFMFETWGAPTAEPVSYKEKRAEISANLNTDLQSMQKIVAAIKLADNIRIHGHRVSKISPLGEGDRQEKSLEFAEYGLTEEDLKSIPVEFLSSNAPEHVKNGLDAIHYLKQLYTQSLAFEFSHVHDVEERSWLNEVVESGAIFRELSNDKRKKLLKRLTEVEGFEQFLHRTFVGQKRFSIEGLDALVPILDEIVSEGVDDGIENVMIGMAHRGRLNVLAHVLNKPYEIIFGEFQHAPNKELVPSEGSTGINYGWTGDVKYHLGADRKITEENIATTRVTLANNPSHLEFVGPVVDGFTRAAQDSRVERGYPVQDVSKAVTIIIHGDAAFPGQGIVAETLNLGNLRGYSTGGSIHIIANNRIGFTTETYDSRSTIYASDLAKGFEVPIVHVNGDDPEACLVAAYLAHEYRRRFHKDFLIDLVGYRRFGHNEMDEPMVTQPQLYKQIRTHETVRNLYAKELIAKGIVTEEESKQIEADVVGKLTEAYQKVEHLKVEEGDELIPPAYIESGLPPIETAVERQFLMKINEDLLDWPSEYSVNEKLARILKRRLDGFKEGGKIDWGHAETLAFATILADGIPIRLTGQDSERGTFAHRHIVLHDSNSDKIFSPLHELKEAKASFAVHNSPLSENAVLAFEYGYNIQAPETLVLWEAQFGDFANGAQVIFDQFISAGEAKWGQRSGLVVLLPHGYEGQGPEHSSARLERYLSLAAENNWTVANLSSAANYFHLLRRQAKMLSMKEVRPLILMTPKSLLRNPLASSDAKELSEGAFRPVIEQFLSKDEDKVERIVMCTGKVAIELQAKVADKDDLDWLHIVRVEEIYPYPMKETKEIFARFPNLKEVVWLQEEPKNMGSWRYIEPYIRESVNNEKINIQYVGRVARSSPAEGDPKSHKFKQERILNQAISR